MIVEADDALACPFCGFEKIFTAVEYGNKWGYAGCSGCGAQTGTIRTQYNADEDAPWRKDAIVEWNQRHES